MKKFMDEDFLLQSEPAKKLYHDYAENMPILDYHCHISPKEIAEDRHFETITQVWLGGDHYKWRLMRAFGVDEKWFRTGEGEMFAKRNPSTSDCVKRYSFQEMINKLLATSLATYAELSPEKQEVVSEYTQCYISKLIDVGFGSTLLDKGL